jgi:hypothetical protein
MLHRLKLIIVHNHFRPGGVRRVIELAAPSLVRKSRTKVNEVVIVTGEAPSTEWKREFSPEPQACCDQDHHASESPLLFRPKLHPAAVATRLTDCSRPC